MAEQLIREDLVRIADIHAAPPQAVRNAPVDRSFELPTRLYGTMAALCVGFVVVTGAGFASPGMILPFSIFVAFLAAFFAVPAIWTRMVPDSAVQAKSWMQFRREGISALTGRLTANEAMAQMLVLPVLLFAWGIVTVTIAALVR